jgi:hypothetical protein
VHTKFDSGMNEVSIITKYIMIQLRTIENHFLSEEAFPENDRSRDNPSSSVIKTHSMSLSCNYTHTVEVWVSELFD